MSLTALLPLALVFLPGAGLDDPPLPAPDSVTLVKRDKVHEGRIVHVDDEHLVLRVKSKLKEFARADVASYEWVDDSATAVLDEFGKGARGQLDKAALHAFATHCGGSNLPGEEQLAHWMVLAQDPSDATSHEALGHRKDGKRYRVPVGTRWVRMDKLPGVTTDFGNALEFHSAHFDLRTNLPLREALVAIADAERIYSLFFESMGSELALYHPAERLGLHLHADERSFPGGGRRKGLYSASDRRTVLDVSAGYDLATNARWLLYHLLDAVGREMGDRTALPGWTTEGLAIRFEAHLGLIGPGAAAIDFDPTRRHERMLALHARAKDPEKLSRVLQLMGGDFYGDERELRWAQSYSLVTFLIEGEDGAHADGFRAFLASAFEGKGSSTHFKKAIGLKEKDLEKRWNAFVGR